MPSGLEPFEELEGECFESSKLRVLPEQSMQGAIDEAIKDAWRLCRSRWAKEIEVHWLLVRAGGDGAIRVELDMQVEEVYRTRGSRRFPFESRPIVAKGVHALHEMFISVGDVALDDESVVNQPSIEEEVVVGL